MGINTQRLKMKKLKRIFIFFVLQLMVIGVSANVYAATLTINTTIDKSEVMVNENVTVKVDWKEGMQAADFILNYDSSKMDFVSSSIENDYLGVQKENGKIKVVWISLNDKDKSDATFTFKTKKQGTAQFSVDVDGGFANGKLEEPSDYNVSTKPTLTIKALSNGSTSDKNNATQKPTTDTTTSKDKIPQTGVGSVLIALPVVLFTAVISIVKYKRYKDI